MKNFRLLNEDEYNKVWDKIYALLGFKPSVTDFPAIKTNMPKVTFDVSACFTVEYDGSNLEIFAIDLFSSISKPGDRLYALDWQHECYDFDPRQEMDRDEFGDWIVPVLPNGDYYFFLTKDFNNIWFGHPWQKTITLIGASIVENGKVLKNPIVA